MNSPAGEYFNGLLVSLMDSVLERARAGTLRQEWREELQLPGGVSHAEGILSDAEVLVLNQIRERPYAAWEPGHVPDWRAALTAWYVDSRNLVTQRYIGATRQNLDQLQLGMELLSSGLGMRDMPGGEGLWARLEDGTETKDLMFDRSCRSQADVYMQARDRLTASYMAGLAAGGDDVNWLGWFKERVSHWSSLVPTGQLGTRRAEIELRVGGESFKASMQRLPQYWLLGVAPI